MSASTPLGCLGLGLIVHDAVDEGGTNVCSHDYHCVQEV